MEDFRVNYSKTFLNPNFIDSTEIGIWVQIGLNLANNDIFYDDHYLHISIQDKNDRDILQNYTGFYIKKGETISSNYFEVVLSYSLDDITSNLYSQFLEEPEKLSDLVSKIRIRALDTYSDHLAKQ
ncbi:MAG: hypothetical protein ACOVOQ_14010 [Flavobacterium sp.]|jgi:hypothetical protein